MFGDTGELRDARKRYNGKMYASTCGDLFRRIDKLEEDALADGALPRKTKELIGLALSIAEDCHG